MDFQNRMRYITYVTRDDTGNCRVLEESGKKKYSQGLKYQELQGMSTKHEKIHLLVIREKGQVKSRKVSFRIIKFIFFLLLFVLVTTSFFTYLYWRQAYIFYLSGHEVATLLKKIDRLRHRIETQDLEIMHLQGSIKRLKSENGDLKQHLIKNQGFETKTTTPVQKRPVIQPLPIVPRKRPVPDKNLVAFKKFLSRIETLKPVSRVTFQIREPKIIVSPGMSKVTFRLYKNTLKKIYGRYILLGIYRPKIPQKTGVVVSYPSGSVAGYKLLPRYGYPFRIDKRFLPVLVKLRHPKGMERFTEFHILVYSPKRKLIFHVKFKAP